MPGCYHLWLTGPPKLSILIPVYNEQDLVATVVARVLRSPIARAEAVEIVAVDDGSSDGSAGVLDELARHHAGIVRVFHHDRNRGKGAAVRTAIQGAAGEFAIIQDADLEYNPEDLTDVMRPLLEGHADAVFGSRFASAGERRVLYFWHSLANRFLTTVCNAIADLNLTDMGTGYKAFRLSTVRSIPLRRDDFGFEPELIIKLAQRGAALYEVPISYRGRTYDEGKKIRRIDSLRILSAIFYYGLRRDIYLDDGARILDALAQTPRFNRWMAAIIQPWVGARVLEIGAGIGNLSQYLAPRRRRYVASDIDAEHLARLRVRFQNRPNMELARCDLSRPEDFTTLEGKSDTVICLNVLEHVADDAVGMRNIASALEPGGRAIVLVPQDQRIYGTLDKVLGHYRRYTEQELRSRMEEAGLEVERVLPFNRATRYPWWFNGRVLKRTHFGRFQLWLFDHMVWLWRRVDGMLPWQAVSIIGVGKKR
ncbi:MAG TPA: bifunctional glycosyltransferase/class I SAM-dependent methyltransferase [Bryobacteraceae bacterium]|nr:bifunctional glycosyltransferase/class I SAM-dependent methyltransferase [Bryobacteraceae bacterium]